MPELADIPPAKTAQVMRFLHVNLNCTDMARSDEIYIALFGMREIMHTESTGQPGAPMGLDSLVDSRVSFLYDHRGARRSPSLELVAWDKPATVLKRYERPNDIGMQAVAYSVPSLDALRAPIAGFGLPVGSLTLGDRNALLFLDPDGVTVEIYEETGLEKAQSRHVRLTVGDLARSQAWYEAIGFDVAEPRAEHSVQWEIPGGDVVKGTVATVRLVMPTDDSYALQLTQWLDPASQGTPKDSANDQGLYRMALGVQDTRAAAAALKAAGWPHVKDPAVFVLPNTPLPDLWISFLRDPDGVTVELVERPVDSYR
ncbi:MAG: lactoylglutathione lyase [Acidimicrobiia bacterium]|nr:lactoylglutathione lyase [Acidimicrobiia bacterium]